MSYEPFDPFATPEPLATATATASTSESPTAAVTTIEPIETVPVAYPTTETEAGGNGSAVGWIIGAVLLLGGGGGGYAYMLHKQNQRKAAQRAAQRRAAAQRSSTGPDGRPYARTNGAAQQPRTGTYTTGGAASPTAQRPMTGAGTAAGTTAAGAYSATQGARKPYSTATGTSATPTSTSSSGTSPYARPEGTGTASAYGSTARRAGRASAYGTTQNTGVQQRVTPYSAPTSTPNPYAADTTTGTDAYSTAPRQGAGAYGMEPAANAEQQGYAAPTANRAGMYGQAFQNTGYTPNAQQPASTENAAGADYDASRVTPRRTASSYGTRRRSANGQVTQQQARQEDNVDFQPDDADDK